MAGENPAKPYAPPNLFGVNQVYWERIQAMRLMDDTLMSAALDKNIEATQLILRIVLEKDDLIITSSTAQREYKNLYGHSVRLDVEATDSLGDKIDIEVQRAKQGAKPKRARYHSALLDTHSLRARQTYDRLPTTYVVFITEEDYWKAGLPVYRVDRTLTNLGNRDFGDCAHIVYVNGEYQGDSPIGRLMADFRTSDPSRMNFPELAARVNALKNSEDEVRKMCRAMEITYEEGLRDGQRDRGANDLRNLMETLGLSLTDALNALKIPSEERQTYIDMIEAE